jgi:hypothetical protein
LTLKKTKPTKTKKNPEFDSGTAAQERFEQTMKTLFRTTKAISKKKGKD